jgi:hypothetical protein
MIQPHLTGLVIANAITHVVTDRAFADVVHGFADLSGSLLGGVLQHVLLNLVAGDTTNGAPATFAPVLSPSPPSSLPITPPAIAPMTVPASRF